jgi:hypothetical protein
MERKLYYKAARMILGSKTREELQTTRNFISLIEKQSNLEDLYFIEKLKKLWLKKDHELFS